MVISELIISIGNGIIFTPLRLMHEAWCNELSLSSMAPKEKC